MIHVYVRGRLGNQLFQYAFVRMLQHYNPEQHAIYHYEAVFREKRERGESEKGEYAKSLEAFHIKGGIEDDETTPKLTIWQRDLLKLYQDSYPSRTSPEEIFAHQKRWVHSLGAANLYYLNQGYHVFPMHIPVENDAMVCGHFESERYFKEIAPQILSELTIKYPSLSHNEALLHHIVSTNSVAVGIRRGDFVDNATVRKVHYVCTPQYYQRAVEYIKAHVPNPVLFIFSDDVTWVKKNLNFGLETYYESGNDPTWEVLRLMSSCKHFIISNSTLHWWAQYMSHYEKKIVVAPDRWLNSAVVSDLYQDHWVRIPVDV